MYPTIADLAAADKDSLAKLGFTKYGAKRLIAWAAAKLDSTKKSESNSDE
jgi:3-methyladenine DNA glycosylase/8-oxoguanine DNA glycosylase